MLSKYNLENALSELEDGITTEAIDVLKYLIDKGSFIVDICDCDIEAKDNCEDCTCGLAHFLDLNERE